MLSANENPMTNLEDMLGYRDSWYVGCYLSLTEGVFFCDAFNFEGFIERCESENGVGLIVAHVSHDKPGYADDIARVLEMSGNIPADMEHIVCLNVHSLDCIEQCEIPQRLVDACTVLYDNTGYYSKQALLPQETITGSQRECQYAGALEDKNVKAIAQSLLGLASVQVATEYDAMHTLQHEQMYTHKRIMPAELLQKGVKFFSMDTIKLYKRDLRTVNTDWRNHVDAFKNVLESPSFAEQRAKIEMVSNLYKLWYDYEETSPKRTRYTPRKVKAHMREYGYDTFVDALVAGVPVDDIFA